MSGDDGAFESPKSQVGTFESRTSSADRCPLQLLHSRTDAGIGIGAQLAETFAFHGVDICLNELHDWVWLGLVSCRPMSKSVSPNSCRASFQML